MNEVSFVEAGELEKRFFEFKNRWYGAVKKVEDLSKFKSGFDEGFRAAIESIYRDIDACKKDVDSFRDQLKHYFPDSRTDIDWYTQKVSKHLDELRALIKDDKELLEGSKELGNKIKELNRKLEEAEEELRGAEKESREVCRKYFDLKNEYTVKRQKIDEGINKELGRVRDKFIQMTSPIVESRDIMFGTRAVSLEELFEILVDKPSNAEKMVLFIKKGGIFGKKAEEDPAKTSVLRYVSKEIMESAEPIRREKEDLISKLESEFKEMYLLEKECEEKERVRKRYEKPVESLKLEIGNLKKSEVFKFSEYDGILELREAYLNKIHEGEKDIKEYLDFGLVSFKTFVELEPDVEKRGLLSELREAKIKAENLERDMKKARDELSAKVSELTLVKASKENTEKQLEDTRAKLTATAKELEVARFRIDSANKKLKELENDIYSKITSVENEFKKRIAEVLVIVGQKTAAEEKAVEEKMESLRSKKTR